MKFPCRRRTPCRRSRFVLWGLVILISPALTPLVRLGAEDLLDLATTPLTTLDVTSDPGRASQATGFTR